jgi:hypothetical protein
LGIGPNPQSPIPNPQSPIPNEKSTIIYLYLKNKFYNNLFNKKNNKNKKFNGRKIMWMQ